MTDIDIVIRCKCGKLLTEMKRETESIYGDRLAISVEPCGDCLDDSFEDGIESAMESA
jgi:hypothetical protein